MMMIGIGLADSQPKQFDGASAPLQVLFQPDMPLNRIGDSITARFDNTDWIQWANFLSYGRFMFPSYGYHAISGSEINEGVRIGRDSQKDILRPDRLAYFTAGSRQGVANLAAIGVNSYGGLSADGIGGNTRAQMAAGFDALIGAIRPTGAAVILATILPAGTTPDPTPVNDDIKARADVDMVWDAWQEWVDTGGYLPNTDQGNGDSLHPNVNGAINAARSAPKALLAQGYQVGATYGVAGSPADNLISPSRWAFTTVVGGAKAGTNSGGISGLVPDGCTLTLNSAGLECAVSLVNRAIPCLMSAGDGSHVALATSQAVLRLTLSGTVNGAGVNSFLVPVTISPGEPAGSMYEGMMYMAMKSANLVSAPVANINCGLTSSSSTLFTWGAASTKNNAGYINQALDGIMRGWTRGATSATGSNGLLFQFRVNPDPTPVDCVIDLAMPYFHKVERTAFAAPFAVHNARKDLGSSAINAAILGTRTMGPSCVSMATASVNLNSAPAMIGGVSPSSGQLVLLPYQSAPSDSGVYTFNGAGVAMTRAASYSDPSSLQGQLIPITGGSFAGHTYYCGVSGSLTVGVTPLYFSDIDPGGPTLGPTVGNVAGEWLATAGAMTAPLRPGEAWSGDALSFTYQWQRSSDKVVVNDIGTAVPVPPAYTPVVGDGYLRGKVVASNEFGSWVSYTEWSMNMV